MLDIAAAPASASARKPAIAQVIAAEESSW